MFTFIGIIIFIAGLIYLIFPKLPFEIRSIIWGWRLGSSQYELTPSKFFLVVNRIMGISLIITGICLVILSLS